MIRRFAFVLAVAVGFATAAAADLETGLALFESGDYRGARDQLVPLAEQGDPRAQYVLGIMFLNYFVEPPRPDAAAEWIRKAAEQDFPDAQRELGRMYWTGDGVDQDFKEMTRWYGRAAEQGDVGAQLFLADAYAYGYGVEPDSVRAYMWYEIAIRYWGTLAEPARNVIADRMTPDQIAEAVARARQWMAEHPE